MKKFLKSIFLFIPIYILFWLLFICIWGEVVPVKLNNNIKYALGAYGHLNTRIKEFPDYKDVDILFLGNSLCYRGFDVRIFQKYGLKVFNFGSSGQTPYQTKILLERYLDVLNPKLVIYVAPDFASDGVESALDLIANDRKDIYNFEMMLTLKNIKVIQTTIFGFYRQIFNRDKNFVEPTTIKEDTYISGGYVEKKLEYYNPPPESMKKENPKKTVYIDYQVVAFQNAVSLIRKRGARLILVNPPLTKSRYSFDEDYIQLMCNYAPYIDFNLLIQLDEEKCFYDDNHLNQNGVEIFNEKLIQLFKLDHFNL